MHEQISIAVPTRHRPDILSIFVDKIYQTTKDRKNKPHLQIIYDHPQQNSRPTNIGIDYPISELTLYDKSSLTELWNLSIILAPTDWVLICNDDIEFKDGWLEYLEETINSGKFLGIHLLNYGAMCFHKSMILRVGWFDERFRNGGYEDNDYQLRIDEAGIRNLIDWSAAHITINGPLEITKFAIHTKHLHKSKIGWGDPVNGQWMMEKWGRTSGFANPSFRRQLDKDWHPRYTMRYTEKYKQDPVWMNIGTQSIKERRPVYG